MHSEDEIISTKLDVARCLQAIKVVQSSYKLKKDSLFNKGIFLLTDEIDRAVLRKGTGVDQEIVEIKMQLAEKGKDIEYLKEHVNEAWIHINDIKKNMDLKFRHVESHMDSRLNDADKRIKDSLKEVELRIKESQRNMFVAMGIVGTIISAAITIVGFLK